MRTISNRILRRHRDDDGAVSQAPSLQCADTTGEALTITRHGALVNIDRTKKGKSSAGREVFVAEGVEGDADLILDHEVEGLRATQATGRAKGGVLEGRGRRRVIEKRANRVLCALRKVRKILFNERTAHRHPWLAALFSVALGTTPAIAAGTAVQDPNLTQQDLNDIATALSIIGSHCNADQLQACQAGADSKGLFAKLEAIYAAQQERAKVKK